MAEGSSNTRDSWIAILVGAVTVFLSVWYLFIKPVDIKKFTATATDAVVTQVRRWRSGDEKYYTPVFTFHDSDHREWEAKSVIEYKKKDRPEVGDKATIRYNPFDPEAGCIVEGHEGRLNSNAFIQWIQLAFGIVITGGGVSSLVKGGKSERGSEQATQ